MINGEIAKKFSELRKQNGLTQLQIANFLGVDQSYISKCEKNERQFGLDILEKSANLFGCPIEFFTNDGSEFKPIPFALRSKEIEIEDLETISVINKIALNMRFMEKILMEVQE